MIDQKALKKHIKSKKKKARPNMFVLMPAGLQRTGPAQ